MTMTSRFAEFRSIASSTLESIFRRLTQEVEIVDHVQQVSTSRADGLQLSEVGRLVPLGRPKYPLYFNEILPPQSMSLAMITEMRLLGLPHIPETESGEALNRSVSTSLHQLDPYLPQSAWTKDLNLLLLDSTSYRVYKHDFRQFLMLLGVQQKGATFIAIDNLYVIRFDVFVRYDLLDMVFCNFITQLALTLLFSHLSCLQLTYLYFICKINFICKITCCRP